MLLRLSERIVARMPVVRGVYGAVKQIFETVLAKQQQHLPRGGADRMAAPGHVDHRLRHRAARGRDRRHGRAPTRSAIYVPTTPNPTSGYLMFVPRRDLVTLPMTVEEGIKLVISGGIVAPPPARQPRAVDPVVDALVGAAAMSHSIAHRERSE